MAADSEASETGKASSGIDTSLDYMYKDDELAQEVSDEEARNGPIGMGFRVPMSILSRPYGLALNATLLDHDAAGLFFR